MNVISTAIEGVVIIEPRVFKDARGYFFESFSQSRLISAESILKDFKAQKKTLESYKAHDLAIVNDSIYRCIENGRGGPACADNLMAYMDWLITSGRKESMAHFCSVFEGATYSQANLFMMSSAPTCFKTITDFIRNL